MNLPQLTAKIGKAAKAEIGSLSELAMLVKSIKVDNDLAYILFLTLDLDKQEIRFDDPIPYTDKAPFQYNYLGNNSAAGMQYYVVREGNSVHYLLKSVLSDLYLVLEKHGLHEGELGKLLRELNEQGIIQLSSKKGCGSVNLNLIRGLSGIVIDEKNNVIVNGTVKKAADFLRLAAQWEHKDTAFVLIVPRVVLHQQTIILSQHPDYVAVAKKEQKLVGLEKKNKNKKKFCYICHERSTNVSSELTTNFSRTGINKIFTTTTFNYAKNIDKKFYDDSYAICGSCFQDLLYGEKKISDSFSSRIAGERAFVLPEGLLDDFQYNRLTALKHGTDLFFNKGLSEDLDDELELAKEEFIHAAGYVIHFIIYRTDGNSVTVLETIEDVPTMRIVRIAEIIGKHVRRLSPHIHPMSLQTIYRMIPVQTNKSGNQLDIHRVLTIYQSLFTKTTLETHVLFGYAVEALAKGFREIRKKNGSQFTNLGWQFFAPDQEDHYFAQMTMRYLCLLKTCQELGILDRDVFQKRGVMKVDLTGMTSNVRAIEAFLEEQSFDKMPRALFYLGVLLRSVAQAQYQKNHKNKPILNKLSFQGMNQREVIWLYQEVLEKLRQYDKMTLENEQYLKMFHHYFGTINEKVALTEQEHLFYIMAGYAFNPARIKEDQVEGEEQSEDEADYHFIP